MAAAIQRESFFWHKLHSLTGIVPIGFYMLQHLTLNTFSLAGPDKFNGVIGFFESLPFHLLITLEVLLLWIPILFHAVYGLFIVNRGQSNYFMPKYGFPQNRMYTLQRWSGVFLFLFLIFHVISTTGAKYYYGSADVIRYDAWHMRLTELGHLMLFLYMIAICAASYHLAYGVWNFCIRWGITISEAAQARIQKFSFWMFVAVTLVGWGALGGFLLHTPETRIEQPANGAPQVNDTPIPS